MAYFQVKNSTNPNKIAHVTRVVDVNSFRQDSNWYELTEAEYDAFVNPKQEAPKEAPAKKAKAAPAKD